MNLKNKSPTLMTEFKNVSQEAKTNNAVITKIPPPSPHKQSIQRAIQLVLAGSLLISGVATAKLLDHGPSDANLTWPQWYRDDQGLALSLCKSTTTYCFPAAPDVNGFAGNIGPEMFYNMVEMKSITTGSDFRYRYLAGLESSYLPVGKPVHGTEIVFARVRIAFSFNDLKKEGTYTITHPFGVETFENVKVSSKLSLFGGGASTFFTVDVPIGPVGNYDLALTGALGPFIQWDADLPLKVGAEEFIGDPTIVHTFTGSPFGTNFLRIDGPVGSNLDGLGHDFIEVYQANVLGQKWTAPIAQPLTIDSVYSTRTATANGIDVWATSSPKQRLIMTGANMPSLQLYPTGTLPGKYHGHVEYPSDQPMVSNVKVTNLSSIPVVSATAAVKDGVEISQSEFDTSTRLVTIVAQSSDELTDPNLAVEGMPGVPSAAGVVPVVSGAMTHAQCDTTVTNLHAMCFSYLLPANVEPPANISVVSAELGFHADDLLNLIGGPQNSPNPPVSYNYAAPGFTVQTGGITNLPTDDKNLMTNLPLDAQIIQQPASGLITLVGAQWIFTANAGVIAGTDSFSYVRQSADNTPVSNEATGTLTLAFNPGAPTAFADQFAATYGGTTAAQITAKTRTVTILGNDKPASTNPLDQINPATTSLTIVTEPTKGNLTKLASGQITYVTKTATAASGGADFFEYKVNNSSDPALTSNTVKVDITNFSAAEVVTVASAKYTIASRKWVVVGTSSWFGPNLANTTATCWTGTGAAPTASTLIGSVPVDSAGNYQLAVSGTAVPTGVDKGALRCKTSNGGLAAGITAAK